jgi:hypothetical protein
VSKRPAKRRQSAPVLDGPNPKAPCPCGSGRRFKACHGSDYAPINARPFAGVPAECDWIALRELVPSATAKLTLADDKYADRDVTLGTVLPLAGPAMVRADGRILVAAQTNIPTLDPGRDIAHALLRALEAEPGAMQDYQAAPYDGPTLAEVLGPDPIEIEVHDDFEFWLDGVDGSAPDVAASLERANETIFPTARLKSVDAAYWCLPGDKAHLRWVMPHPEDRLLDALARLSASGELGLGDETRFAGSFRAQGLLAPVWDLPSDAHADEWEKPAKQMLAKIDAALAVEEPLNESERRARAGLIGRQITLR